MNAFKFSAKSYETGDQLKLELTGYLDENTVFPEIINSPKAMIVIDLGGIKYINSLGVRAWIKWISGNQKATFVFENCPTVIITACNMFSIFFPKNSTVKSFFVPFYSESSGEERSVLLKYGVDFDEKGVRTPKNILDSQSAPMKPEFIESHYYKFLLKKYKSDN